MYSRRGYANSHFKSLLLFCKTLHAFYSSYYTEHTLINLCSSYGTFEKFLVIFIMHFKGFFKDLKFEIILQNTVYFCMQSNDNSCVTDLLSVVKHSNLKQTSECTFMLLVFC